MKLTQPDLKIKCKYAHTKTLYEYLMEIINNSEAYLKTFVSNSNVRTVYKHHIATICEKVAKLMFNNLHNQQKNFTLKLNEAERMSLYILTSNYPLPMDINFIEYEIKKGLLK